MPVEVKAFPYIMTVMMRVLGIGFYNFCLLNRRKP
jgi:hypothetical protein